MDPNEVVGSPTERQIWLAPDWSKRGSTAAIAGPGSTQVYTRTVTYRDGRVVTYVLDENHNPITSQKLSEDTDPTLKEAWDKAKAQANAQAGVTKPTNVYVGTNPSTGKPTQVSEWPDGHKSYDDTQVPAAQASQGQTTNAEGTQRPDGSWDNEQPREVVRDSTGKVISSKPLEGAALKDWRESRERSRNPGGKTDQQIKDDQTAAQNAATAAAASRRADSAEARAIAEANKVGSKVEDLTIQGQHYTRITKTSADGKATTIENYGPDGKQIATLPSAEVPTAYGVEPEGAPAFDPTMGQLTTGLQTYSSYLSQQVKLNKDSGGKQGIAPEQATKLMDRRIGLAESAMKEQQGQQSQGNTVRGQALTQRGQDVNEVASRRGDAAGVFKSTEDRYMQFLAHLKPGAAGTWVDARDQALNRARDYVGSYGGLRDVPGVVTGQDLAAASAAARTGVQTAATGGPVLFSGGLRAASELGQPGDPSLSDTTATNEAARQQAAAVPTAPAAVQGQPSVLGDTGAPAVGQQRIVGNGMPPASPDRVPAATNPINNQPITVPSTPVDPRSIGAPEAPAALPVASDSQPVGGRVLPQPAVEQAAAPPADTGQQFGPPQDFVRVQNPTTGETGYLPRADWYGRGDAYPGWQEESGSSARTVGPGDPVQVPDADPGQTVPYPSNAGAESVMQPGYDLHGSAAALAARLGISPEIMAQAITRHQQGQAA